MSCFGLKQAIPYMRNGMGKDVSETKSIKNFNVFL